MWVCLRCFYVLINFYRWRTKPFTQMEFKVDVTMLYQSVAVRGQNTQVMYAGKYQVIVLEADAQ